MLDSPKTPTAISKQTGIRIEHVTRAIRELEKKNLVKCLTPRSKRGRLK
jgi:DNA-binding MarR family transcriptional regulator